MAGPPQGMQNSFTQKWGKEKCPGAPPRQEFPNCGTREALTQADERTWNRGGGEIRAGAQPALGAWALRAALSPDRAGETDLPPPRRLPLGSREGPRKALAPQLLFLPADAGLDM